MTHLKLKGHSIAILRVKDSFNRRALAFKNKILTTLRSIGLSEDDVEIDMEAASHKRLPASASWYLEGYHMHYSYNQGNNFAENLYVVSKVIESEIALLIQEKRTIEEFINEFCEEKDVKEARIKAREVLGVSSDSHDLDEIDKKFKALARNHHPDMPKGDVALFKEINND